MNFMKHVLPVVMVATLLGGISKALAGETDHGTTQTPAQEIQWVKAPFGPEVSPVMGDFSSGQHVTLVRFAPGMKTPVHTHSHSYTGVVLSGTTRHYVPGQKDTEVELPAGSHWSIPGNQEHISECLGDEECVMVLYQSDKFDFMPTE